MTYQLKFSEGPSGLSFSLNFFNNNPTCFSDFNSLITGNVINDHGKTKIQNQNFMKNLTHMSGHKDLKKSIEILEGIPYVAVSQLVTNALPVANSPTELLAICENFVNNLHIDLLSEYSSPVQLQLHNSG